ncbi:MAG TPA: transcriptional repressor [Beijerinckiaceae bacterium]|jgi:Fur family zinc uptake transcriptional regulator
MPLHKDQPHSGGHAPDPGGEAGPCAHAAHRSAHAPDALAEAEALCRTKGVRLTPIRRDVLSVLHGTHRPLGAYDIADALGDKGHRRLAPITVYRALEFLMGQGLAHRLASRNAFVACPHRHAPQDLVAFLICEACGGVDEMSSAPLGRALSGLLAAERFEPHLQVLEISGFCAHCREPGEPAGA